MPLELGPLLGEELGVELSREIALFGALRDAARACVPADGGPKRRRLAVVDGTDGARGLHPGGFGRLENLDARHADFSRYFIYSHSSTASSPAMSLATACAAA